jgi:hypothetical protein
MIVVDMLSPGAIVAIAGRGKDRHHSGTNAQIAASASPPAHRRQRVAASAGLGRQPQRSVRRRERRLR